MTDFPSTPTTGQKHTLNGLTYEWNGNKWVLSPGAIVNKANVLKNGNIDLSQGNYHLLQTNQGTVINFNNFPSGSSKWTLEIDVGDVSKYDIRNSNNAPLVDSIAITGDRAFQTHFKPDGTKVFYAGLDTKNIGSRVLDTPWELSSATLSETLYVGGYESSPYIISFDPSGSILYTGGFTTKKIYQFGLSEPWDLTAASLSNTFSTASDMPNGGPSSLVFKPDGTKMFALGWPTGVIGSVRVFEYALATPWEVSTASLPTGSSYPVGTQDAYSYGVDFRSDGRKMYTVGPTADRVHQYSLSTPWQVNTATYDTISALPAGSANPYHASFNPTGSRLYITELSGGVTNSSIREYKTTFTGQLYSGTTTFPNNVVWGTGTAPIISSNTVSVIDFYTPDSGSTIYGIEKVNTRLANTQPYDYGISAPLLTVSGNTGVWSEQSIDVSKYAGAVVRLVFEYDHVAPFGSGDLQLDAINIDGTFYDFENKTHFFESSAAQHATYSVVTWSPVAVDTTTVGKWNVRTGATPSSITSETSLPNAASGSYYIYAESSTSTITKIWLRSQPIFLSDTPSFSFSEARYGSGIGTLNVRLDVSS